MTNDRPAEAPADSPAPPQFLSPRALEVVKVAVVVMGVVLVLGFAAVVFVISRKLSAPDPSPAVEEEAAPLFRSDDLTSAWWREAHVVSKPNLPKGAEVRQMTLAGDRIALLIEAPEGRQIVLFDLVALREIGVIRLTEGEPGLEDVLPPETEADVSADAP